jgi:hypothetical protein
VTDHLYARGQLVTYTAKRFIGPAWSGAFIITKLLPSGGEEPRYEIKNMGERYTRAALERDLSAGVPVLQTTAL